jgi:hypothetical protein
MLEQIIILKIANFFNTMFRSEEMLFYQLIMPRESAWAIMD